MAEAGQKCKLEPLASKLLKNKMLEQVSRRTNCPLGKRMSIFFAFTNIFVDFYEPVRKIVTT